MPSFPALAATLVLSGAAVVLAPSTSPGTLGPAVTPASRLPAAASASPRWLWPLTPRPAVARAFTAPESGYGAGHRGVDLVGAVGAPVRAVAQGRVSHVGAIAGRVTVSVVHASGVRSTYEPLDPVVVLGQQVAAGDVLGVLASPGHCSSAACLHLGALRERTYLNPLLMLTATRVRLLPVDSATLSRGRPR